MHLTAATTVVVPEFGNLVNVVKVFGLFAVSFIITMAMTPFLSRLMYRYELWRKDVRTSSPDGSATPLFAALHKNRETKVPRLGGALIWLTTGILAFGLWLVSRLSDSSFWDKANFLSRDQTWLPFVTLLAASFLGLGDDLAQVWKKSGSSKGSGGIKFRHRLFAIFLIALAGAWWFYAKLGWRTIYLPGLGDIFIGFWYIPLFVAVMILLFSSSIVDGIDGLSGGVFASIFGAYAGIAFFRGQINIAAFAAVIIGALLGFLWFNIPPARFYMGESGMLGLTTSLTVIAFLTDSVIALPIIGFILMIEVASDVIQFISKRYRGKKVFLIAPIHHHFEAKGWAPEKVTMRFWVIGAVAAVVGMVVALIGR